MLSGGVFPEYTPPLRGFRLWFKVPSPRRLWVLYHLGFKHKSQGAQRLQVQELALSLGLGQSRHIKALAFFSDSRSTGFGAEQLVRSLWARNGVRVAVVAAPPSLCPIPHTLRCIRVPMKGGGGGGGASARPIRWLYHQSRHPFAPLAAPVELHRPVCTSATSASAHQVSVPTPSAATHSCFPGRTYSNLARSPLACKS